MGEGELERVPARDDRRKIPWSSEIELDREGNKSGKARPSHQNRRSPKSVYIPAVLVSATNALSGGPKILSPRLSPKHGFKVLDRRWTNVDKSFCERETMKKGVVVVNRDYYKKKR